MNQPTTNHQPPTTNRGAGLEPENTMGDQIHSMLQLHALNGSQRQADGAAAYAENLRYDYLEGKNSVSFAEATGTRLVTESGSGRARDQVAGGANRDA